jgi:hypothetical protein
MMDRLNIKHSYPKGLRTPTSDPVVSDPRYKFPYIVAVGLIHIQGIYMNFDRFHSSCLLGLLDHRLGLSPSYHALPLTIRQNDNTPTRCYQGGVLIHTLQRMLTHPPAPVLGSGKFYPIVIPL